MLANWYMLRRKDRPKRTPWEMTRRGISRVMSLSLVKTVIERGTIAILITISIRRNQQMDIWGRKIAEHCSQALWSFAMLFRHLKVSIERYIIGVSDEIPTKIILMER